MLQTHIASRCRHHPPPTSFQTHRFTPMANRASRCLHHPSPMSFHARRFPSRDRWMCGFPSRNRNKTSHPPPLPRLRMRKGSPTLARLEYSREASRSGSRFFPMKALRPKTQPSWRNRRCPPNLRQTRNTMVSEQHPTDA